MANILIIDDEVSILELLSIFLRNKGHTVSTAATGTGGLELFYLHKPDIVFLDVRLPDRDGLEILCEMQAEQWST